MEAGVGGAYLNEAYVLRVLTEALTAHVQPIFPDQAVAVGADAARARALAELPRVTPVELLVTHLVFSRHKRRKASASFLTWFRTTSKPWHCPLWAGPFYIN